MSLYLRTPEGIRQTPEKKPIKALFCRHKNRIKGESCSRRGLTRISGEDIYEVCEDCGKILSESHFNYS